MTTKTDTWRIGLATAGELPTEANPAVLVSGLPAWARALYVGSDLRSGSIDLRAITGPGGLPYNRRWTLAAGQYVAIDVSALDGLRLECTRMSGIGTLIARATDVHPDWRWMQPASWYEAGGAAVTTLVPPGAVAVVPLAAAPGWSWVARDRAGAVVAVPTPLVAGVEVPVETGEFNPGAAGIGLLWRIRL